MATTLQITVAGGDTATPRNLAKRLALIARYAPIEGARVLDAGCGAGEYVVALAQRGAHVQGVEYQSEKLAQWQRTHVGDARVQRGDIASLPFPNSSFDVVLLNEVLEHVPDERAALGELHRVLHPNGRLLLFSPNRRYPFETHGVDSYHTGERIAPVRTLGLPYLPSRLVQRLVRPWARNYWPGELRRLVTECGFRVDAQDYVWQTFENISHRQGALLRALSPVFRFVATVLERTPFLRTFGASQLIVAARAPS